MISANKLAVEVDCEEYFAKEFSKVFQSQIGGERGRNKSQHNGGFGSEEMKLRNLFASNPNQRTLADYVDGVFDLEFQERESSSSGGG